MIETHLTLSTGENIHIFDNVFNSCETQRIRSYVETSVYKLGRVSFPTINLDQTSFFQSMYTSEDMEKLEFNKSNNVNNIFKNYLVQQHIARQWVNVATHLTDYRFHTDSLYPGNKTLMYYVNTKWDSDWGGETLFKNTNGELEKAVEFKPNRMVLFDSHLSHKPTQTSINADMYRFIMVMQFIHIPGDNI